ILFVLAAAAATVRVDAAELGAPATRAVGLHEIIGLALKQNATLGAAVADVDYALGQVIAARGLDDLSLDAFGQTKDSRAPLVAGIPFQVTASDDLQGWAQLTQPLPTGGKVGLRFFTEWTKQLNQQQQPDGSFMATPSTQWQPSLQLVFSHS